MKTINLEKVLPEELFDEVGDSHLLEDDLVKMPDITKNSQILNSLYEPNSFFGSSSMELYEEDDGYYMRRTWSEPIGDYGTHWYAQWYKCNDNPKAKSILESEALQDAE